MVKQKYYSLDKILTHNALYNVIIGERSNGKTFACLLYGLKNYVKTGKQMAYIRRWQDDFTGKRGATMFDAIVHAGLLERITEGRWTNVYFWSGRWYLSCVDGDGKRVTDETPFCYAFALTQMEHDKSTSYPNVTTVIFDEFLTRQTYLPDEFILFQNVLSTIIRGRNDVKIFMLGNTVNKWSPYFSEMGLTHIKDMEIGSIDVYTYGESGLTVAVEFTGSNKQSKASDVYFAFDNPRLNMITGTGNIWEMAIYPHCPVKYTPADVLYNYFIIWDGEVLHCEVVRTKYSFFTFIHRKTTPIQDDNKDLIYSVEYDSRPNHRRKITASADRLDRLLYSHFQTDRVYYQDNEVGEIVRNYLKWCRSQN